MISFFTKKKKKLSFFLKKRRKPISKAGILSVCSRIYWEWYSTAHSKVDREIDYYLSSFRVNTDLLENEKEKVFFKMLCYTIKSHVKLVSYIDGTNYWEGRYRDTYTSIVEEGLSSLHLLSLHFKEFMDISRMDSCSKEVNDNRIRMLELTWLLINGELVDSIGLDWSKVEKNGSHVGDVKNMHKRIKGFLNK